MSQKHITMLHTDTVAQHVENPSLPHTFWSYIFRNATTLSSQCFLRERPPISASFPPAKPCFGAPRRGTTT